MNRSRFYRHYKINAPHKQKPADISIKRVCALTGKINPTFALAGAMVANQ